MRKSLAIALAIAIALVATAAALADNGNTPQFPDQTTTVKFRGVNQYGLQVAMKVDDHIVDGQNSKFWLAVRRTSGDPMSGLLVARLGWNFCSGNYYHWTTLDSTALLNTKHAKKTSAAQQLPPAPQSVTFVGSDQHWMRIGLLHASDPFVVAGKLQVPNRSDNGAPHAMMLCMVLNVRSYAPGTGLKHIDVYTNPLSVLYSAS